MKHLQESFETLPVRIADYDKDVDAIRPRYDGTSALFRDDGMRSPRDMSGKSSARPM